MDLESKVAGLFGTRYEKEEIIFEVENLRLALPQSHRATIARRKDCRTEVARLSSHDGLIVNSVFESCVSQSPSGFVQAPFIVGYPYDGHQFT